MFATKLGFSLLSLIGGSEASAGSCFALIHLRGSRFSKMKPGGVLTEAK
jgi:hypothetical protein